MDQTHASCPFCPFSDSDADFVSQHIDFCHPENGVHGPESLPQQITEPTSSLQPIRDDSTEQFVDCPHGCGEIVTAAELSTHLDLHVAEGIALDEHESPHASLDARLASSDHDFSDQENTFDTEITKKGAKRGADRDFTRKNSSKPGRARSPPNTAGADGAKRLGVCAFVLDHPLHLHSTVYRSLMF